MIPVIDLTLTATELFWLIIIVFCSWVGLGVAQFLWLVIDNYFNNELIRDIQVTVSLPPMRISLYIQKVSGEYVTYTSDGAGLVFHWRTIINGYQHRIDTPVFSHVDIYHQPIEETARKIMSYFDSEWERINGYT